MSSCKTNECDGSIRLELGTVFFASEKGCLQCVFEDNCRHPVRSLLTQVSLHYLIFVDFALIFSETNRPFVEVGHVLEYHLATAREMARHQMIHSYHEALSAIARSLPIIVIIIITLIVTSS